MVEFTPINIDLHKSHLIKLTVEYFTWIGDELQERYNIDTFSIIGGDILEYIEKTLEDLTPYEPPEGIYYIIQNGDSIIGMGALRTIKKGIGEIKRMYIQPNYRGNGYGKKVLSLLLKKAEEFRFSSIRLDTGDFMNAACQVYRLAGFQVRERYLESEVPTSFLPHWLFMEKFF